MRHLQTQFFAELEERVSTLQMAGYDLIRLDVGSPDLLPAPHIVQALAGAARLPDRHGYQSHRGPLSLRQAWSELYRREFGVDLDPDSEVLPLLGSKEGIFHLMMACLEPGDLVVVPDPGYMTYARGARFAGAQVYETPLLPQNGYLPDLNAIPARVARQAKMMWLNYPNNPTGAVADLDFFARAVEFAREYELLLCHDAAYALVTYDGYRSPSLLQVPGAMDVSIEFNSLSKSHNMAGWRIGAALGQPEAIQSLFNLKTNIDSGHFLPIWEAAIAAATGDQAWLPKRNGIYQRRRNLVVAGLRAMGLAAALPRASIYVWCPIPAGWRSVDFSLALLEDAHLSLTPGTVFGAAGEGYARISLTAPQSRLETAMRRLEDWMNR
jgi:LL-diaminopimelate aminotransferase